MKKVIALVFCAALIFCINLVFENQRNKIKPVLDPENTEFIHFSRFSEEGEETLWDVMNSSEKQKEILNILGKAERRNYKENFENKLTDKKYYVHFTGENGQEFIYFGNADYVCSFYGKGYEIINGKEIQKEIDAFLEENGG